MNTRFYQSGIPSPIKHANLTVLCRYGFRACTPAGGGLRPLRDPATADADEDDEEG